MATEMTPTQGGRHEVTPTYTLLLVFESPRTGAHIRKVTHGLTLEKAHGWRDSLISHNPALVEANVFPEGRACVARNGSRSTIRPLCRVWLDSLEDAPLVPNSLGASSEDEEPQRLVPIYLDFEAGRWFYYENEAADLHAGASRNDGE